MGGKDLMKRDSLLIALLITALIVISCASSRPYNPFKINKDQFYGKVEKIACYPVAIITKIELTNEKIIKAKFDSLIVKKLITAGFLVVPSNEVAEIQETVKEQVGDLFDPKTGKPDSAKWESMREQIRQELKTKFNADVTLYPHIRTVKAGFSGGKARWFGTSESLGPKGFLKSLLSQSGRYSGGVPALALFVQIDDLNGDTLYIKGGGIQVLHKLSGGSLEDIPAEELFAYEERNIEAVNIALDSLVINAKSIKKSVNK